MFDVADGVELCTLAHNLTGAPNWARQFATVAAISESQNHSHGEFVKSSERSSSVEKLESAARFRLKKRRSRIDLGIRIPFRVEKLNFFQKSHSVKNTRECSTITA